MHLLRKTIALSALFCTIGYLATEVKHTNIHSSKNQLILDILKLSLSKSNDNYQFIEAPTVTSIPRKIKNINDGSLSVIWAGTSINLERQLLAIKIPLFKGFFGYRLLVIRKGEQQQFDGINSLEDLKKLKAGQGTYWVDTKVLREHALPVVTSDKIESLYPMLLHKRFDYFPRALHEPWVELEKYSNNTLEIEQNLLLKYPSAMYFFVSLENKELANKIEYGLNKAIDDGSFDKLFFNNKLIKNALDLANLKNRTEIQLTNSSLPQDVPTDVKKYWINIEK